MSISNLPEDISQEILFGLPVKNLVRFKSVSKSFNFLIHSTDFIKEHINHSIQKHNVTFISTDYRMGKSQFISLKKSLLDSPSNEGFMIEHKNYSFGTSAYSRIISFCGSSNGLLCICFGSEFRTDEQIVLLNPSTTEFKKIDIPRKLYESRARIRSLFWFGYDFKMDDYKLVRVERFEEFCYPRKESFEVEVYTLGAGSWRNIGNVIYKFEEHQPGVLVNGGLHWFVVSLVKQVKVLVSFDIANERFVEVPVPNEQLTYPEEPLEDPKYEKKLGELGGRLCLLFHVFGVRVDVWVMQEYGVRESWTKSFTITEDIISKTFYLRLKWSFVNNEILLQCDDKLILYDPKSERYRKLAVCQTNMEAVSYVTSLVSLNSGRYLSRGGTGGSDGA